MLGNSQIEGSCQELLLVQREAFRQWRGAEISMEGMSIWRVRGIQYEVSQQWG